MSRPAFKVVRGLKALAAALGACAFIAGCGPSPELMGGARRATVDCDHDEEARNTAPAAPRSRLAVWIQASLDKTDLRPEQRALTASIVADLDVKIAPSREGRRRIAARIAAEIEAGSLTEARLEAHLSKLARSDEAAGAAIDAAANRLFGALEGRQRSRFVHAMRQNFRLAAPDIGGKGKGKGKHGARALIEELDLSKDQKRAVRAKIRDEIKESMGSAREHRHALRDRLRAAARSFRGEQFDASGIGRDALAMKRANLTMRLRIASAALPSLSAEQRGKVAAHIRAQSDSLD
ncbi:MAG: hypothetical protein HUU21_19540 [Polyangiaceae bacterium]|nr:hypothetical protein [Polyangiaceae bacterium]